MPRQPSPVIPMPQEVVVEVPDDLDCVVLQLRGRLSLRSNARIRESIAKSLGDTGRVLIDLSQLYCTQTSFLTVFPAALAAAGGWPSARLVLFGADAALQSALSSVRIPETVLLAADFAAAHALLDRRPPVVRRHRDLPMHPSAATGGRMLVRDACTAWSLPQDIRESAELVANELISNAVEHAQTSSRVTVTYTGAVFRIAVHDYCPVPIRPRPIEIGARRGRGLQLVATLAQTWCVDRHPDGKTVWANLAVDPPQLGGHDRRIPAQTDQPLPGDGVGLGDQ
jgi:anti-sigma regulatory factor (Ser/Thr protein kinase)/anti-anti-sigma regulatory factor